MKFKDAGFAFNLPFPPLVRRNVSIILVCDASGNSRSLESNPMRRVEAWAARNNIKLPKIDYNVLINKPLSVWGENEPDVPLCSLCACPDGAH